MKVISTLLCKFSPRGSTRFKDGLLTLVLRATAPELRRLFFRGGSPDASATASSSVARPREAKRQFEPRLRLAPRQRVPLETRRPLRR